MKEYDRVRLTVEKEKYAKDGAHKGMVGWICDARIINEQRLVCFDECDLDTFPILPIKEYDLEVIWELPLMQVGSKVILFTDAYVNSGLSKGLLGTVVAKGAKDRVWQVHFHKQNGLDKEIEFWASQDNLADLEVVGNPEDWHA